MSWAGPEDIYLSTSLASYLDIRGLSIGCHGVIKPTTECHMEKLLVLLRDGRKLLGTLRSFDQFGTDFQHNMYHACPTNAVIEGACDRIIVGDLYCDIPLGLYVIRGENVVLIGELAQKAEREASELKGTMKRRMDFLDMD
ncbi:hypothetical protein ACJIZ3_020539 [Penstemon smallii]|uniref:U6 snRNA-associated Sm-like protein LSm1 n=1 Tax=Penstemon smallii TaxID=265156 RepID=A0ABD3SIW6_9LAMI